MSFLEDQMEHRAGAWELVVVTPEKAETETSSAIVLQALAEPSRCCIYSPSCYMREEV